MRGFWINVLMAFLIVTHRTWNDDQLDPKSNERNSLLIFFWKIIKKFEKWSNSFSRKFKLVDRMFKTTLRSSKIGLISNYSWREIHKRVSEYHKCVFNTSFPSCKERRRTVFHLFVFKNVKCKTWVILKEP